MQELDPRSNVSQGTKQYNSQDQNTNPTAIGSETQSRSPSSTAYGVPDLTRPSPKASPGVESARTSVVHTSTPYWHNKMASIRALSRRLLITTNRKGRIPHGGAVSRYMLTTYIRV